MESIQVNARFTPDGAARPLNFEWRGQVYRVDSIGRRWQGQDGQHILVLVTGGRAFHLLFKAGPQTWHLVRGGEIPTVPVT